MRAMGGGGGVGFEVAVVSGSCNIAGTAQRFYKKSLSIFWWFISLLNQAASEIHFWDQTYEVGR